MRRIVILILLSTIPLISTAQDDYKQPFPHSNGAQLLAYCQQTDMPISQLRCNYYMQGVADLATQVPLACIPRGTNQSELMKLAIEYLESVNPKTLEKNSAASLVLKDLQKKFPCAKKKTPTKTPQEAFAEALKKRLEQETAKKAAEQ